MEIKDYVEKLTSEEFEDLCTEYMEYIYKGKNIIVHGTRYRKDGGKDIEAHAKDVPYEIWAECKKHQRSLGLEDIAKNVILVLSKGIRELVYFSTSKITHNAIKHISIVAVKHDFSVSFFHGEKLYTALAQLPRFQNMNIVSQNTEPETLVVDRYFSTFEDTDSYTSEKNIVLQRDNFFYIDLFLSNYHADKITNVKCDIPKSCGIIFSISPIDEDFSMTSHSTRIVQIRGEIINNHAISVIPKIKITYTLNRRPMKILADGGSVDPTHLIYYPLIGEDIQKFLLEKMEPIFSADILDKPFILCITGNAGSGKSRLLNECMQKAKNRGYQNLYLDARKQDSLSILREWLCTCLGLPYSKGNIVCTLKELKTVIFRYNGSSDIANAIYKFVFEKEVSEEILYYIREALIYFTQNPVGNEKIYLAIDNVQCLNSDSLNILYNVLLHQVSKPSKAFFGISVNTEVVPQENQKNTTNFVEKLTFFEENICIPYYCNEMTDDDAKTLYLHAIPDLQNCSMLTDMLVNKSGKRPFDIIMTIHLLFDSGIIKHSSCNMWDLCDEKLLCDKLSTVPPKSEQLIDERFKMQQNKSFLCNTQRKFYDVFRIVVKSVLYFNGSVPVAFLDAIGIDEDMVQELVQSFFFKFDERYPIISFFHDNIYHFFAQSRQFFCDRELSLKIVQWLEQNKWYHAENRSVILFECYMRASEYEMAAQYGIKAVREELKNRNFSSVVKIGLAMLEEPSITISLKEQFELLYAIASSYSINVDLSKSLRYFQDAEELLTDGEDIDISDIERCRFYHQYANACLFEPQIEKFLNVLQKFETNCVRNKFYEFILNNRYSVAYLALGELDSAKKYIELALRIAREEKKTGWESVAYSDKAYIYYRGYEDQEKTLKYFKEAVNTHDAKESDFTRKSEILVQKALAELLENDYEKASKSANKALEEARAVNSITMEIKSRNMCAIVECFQKKYSDAIDRWNTNLIICNQHNSKEGMVKALTNIGATLAMQGSIQGALPYCENAYDIFRSKHLSFMNHKPLMYNFLHIYQIMGNDSKKIEILENNYFDNLVTYSNETASGDHFPTTGYWPIHCNGFFLNY